MHILQCQQVQYDLPVMIKLLTVSLGIQLEQYNKFSIPFFSTHKCSGDIKTAWFTCQDGKKDIVAFCASAMEKFSKTYNITEYDYKKQCFYGIFHNSNNCSGEIKQMPNSSERYTMCDAHNALRY